MLKPMVGNVIVVLIGLSMTGCSIYDKYREWPAEPVALSYPVPCLGLDWH